MFSLFNRSRRSSTESVDMIEKIVHEYLKPLGFRKHGRTLHRYVDGDISQVVHFQNGCHAKGIHNILWVNLGIRVPECVERSFVTAEPLKKYYHEYECNIRTTLGVLVDGKETSYDLKKDPAKIANDIVKRIKKYVLPVFDTLNSRDAIVKHRGEYAHFDQMNHCMILLEEAMIYGRKGDLAEATRLFNAHYQNALAEYNHACEYGTMMYLKKGETLMYRNVKSNEIETITATKSGHVTTHNPKIGHIEYLQDLAKTLGIVLDVT